MMMTEVIHEMMEKSVAYPCVL